MAETVFYVLFNPSHLCILVGYLQHRFKQQKITTMIQTESCYGAAPREIVNGRCSVKSSAPKPWLLTCCFQPVTSQTAFVHEGHLTDIGHALRQLNSSWYRTSLWIQQLFNFLILITCLEWLYTPSLFCSTTQDCGNQGSERYIYFALLSTKLRYLRRIIFLLINVIVSSDMAERLSPWWKWSERSENRITKHLRDESQTNPDGIRFLRGLLNKPRSTIWFTNKCKNYLFVNGLHFVFDKKKKKRFIVIC